MTKKELADGLSIPLFADRNSIKEAIEYAYEIAKASGKKNEAHIITALHVVLNTVAREIARAE